ncbi:MAG: phage holin family protein [Candidatus Jorgensenbacteria bacterium]|nr:phage holin family protein [Candidatus Jorgensenbacteria bacterium]
MGLIGRFILHTIGNAIGIYVASYFIQGFSFVGDFLSLIVAAAILAVIQAILKPILKLFLGPLIVLTLGLFSIVINALLLIILDFLSKDLTIQGYLPLLYATLIISVINIVVSVGGRETKKD